MISKYLKKVGDSATYLGDSIINKHISGEVTLGLSPFVNDTEVLNGGMDFDIHKPTKIALDLKLKEFKGDKKKLDNWLDTFLEEQRKQREQQRQLEEQKQEEEERQLEKQRKEKGQKRKEKEKQLQLEEEQRQEEEE